jgi:competence protein ComEC
MARILVADIACGAAASFLVGVLGASFGWPFLGDVAFVIVLFGFVFGSFKIITSWTAIAFCFSALCFGVWYFPWYLRAQDAWMRAPIGKPSSFSAIITDEPKPSTKVLVLSVDLKSPWRGPLMIFAPLGRDFHYGDMVAMTGTVAAPNSFGTIATIAPQSIDIVAEQQGFWLRDWLIRLKARMLEKLNEVLPEDEATLLGGILLGSKTGFRADLKNAMALSGTTHLVAISGYNITIVIVATEQVLGRILSRRQTFFVTITLLVLFVLMTGLSSSAIRAGVMGFLALIAKQSGRLFSMRNAIAGTAAGMVALDPRILTGDIGFALSFLSLLGIVCLIDPLKKLFRYESARTGFATVFDWKESAITTFAAQIAVIPVIVAVFGNFSATAIIANVLVLGTVPLTMLLGFVLAVAGFLSQHLSFLIAKITWLILAYQLAIIRLFATLAVPLPISFGSTIGFIIYYGALGLFINERKQHV